MGVEESLTPTERDGKNWGGSKPQSCQQELEVTAPAQTTAQRKGISTAVSSRVFT